MGVELQQQYACDSLLQKHLTSAGCCTKGEKSCKCHCSLCSQKYLDPEAGTNTVNTCILGMVTM